MMPHYDQLDELNLMILLVHLVNDMMNVDKNIFIYIPNYILNIFNYIITSNTHFTCHCVGKPEMNMIVDNVMYFPFEIIFVIYKYIYKYEMIVINTALMMIIITNIYSNNFKLIIVFNKNLISNSQQSINQIEFFISIHNNQIQLFISLID